MRLCGSTMNVTDTDSLVRIDIEESLVSLMNGEPQIALSRSRISRTKGLISSGIELIADHFRDHSAISVFIRMVASHGGTVRLVLFGQYAVNSCPSGGWLVTSKNGQKPAYWIPQPPVARTLDRDGHIQSSSTAEVLGLFIDESSFSTDIRLPGNGSLDLVIWRLDSSSSSIVSELVELRAIERQPAFVWSSHTLYQRAGDSYAHLIHGHVYENHEVWPRYWRVCSELDAYALYVIHSGLEASTGKTLYGLLKAQLIISVIDRQKDDGGWYHGEWTDRMESHYRLCCAGIHMLAAEFEANADERVLASLEKAVAFISGRAQTTDAGVWFVHDSLEADDESIRCYPFRWTSSRAFGKARSNMLILNTHLDSIVALDRYREVTGDQQYITQVTSACNAAEAVFKQRPAEWLYRILFRILDLSLYPKNEALKLPIPIRVAKRVGWKYLAPNLHRIKALWPRVIMPNGYIERSLTQAGHSTRYQSVHVWDLIRFKRRFSSSSSEQLLKKTLKYTQLESRVRQNWKEDPSRHDALGFWQDALYFLLISKPDPIYVEWLAQAIMDSTDVGVGISPSLLGGNAEAVRPGAQTPCPAAFDARLRVANLSASGRVGFLLVNPTQTAIATPSILSTTVGLSWRSSAGVIQSDYRNVPSRGWLWAQELPS